MLHSSWILATKNGLLLPIFTLTNAISAWEAPSLGNLRAIWLLFPSPPISHQSLTVTFLQTMNKTKRPFLIILTLTMIHGPSLLNISTPEMVSWFLELFNHTIQPHKANKINPCKIDHNDILIVKPCLFSFLLLFPLSVVFNTLNQALL